MGQLNPKAVLSCKKQIVLKLLIQFKMQNDKLYYFSRSADNPPGSGRNEFVNNVNAYAVLSATPNWRQMLSNFWVAPFEYNGLWWNSVEHMFQAYKINLADPAQALQFTLNSGSALGRAPGSEAQKNRKLVRLTPPQLQQWEQIKFNVLYNALKNKFMQNPELAKVLLATHNAELWHGAPRVSAARQYQLEQVRRDLHEASFIPVTFAEAFQLLSTRQIVNYKVISKPTGNALIELYDNLEQIYLVKARYDSHTQQIFAPI